MYLISNTTTDFGPEQYPTFDEALTACKQSGKSYIGKGRAPRSIDSFMNGWQFVDSIGEDDPDWKDHRWEATVEQTKQLDAKLKSTVAEWVAENDLRPDWTVVDAWVQISPFGEVVESVGDWPECEGMSVASTQASLF